MIRTIASLFYLLFALFLAEALPRLYFSWQARDAVAYTGKVVFLSTVREGAGHSLWKTRWLEYQPNASLEMDLGDGSHYSIRISKDGYRTHDITPKQPGVFRILAIGASTTLQGDTNDSTYPAYLEQSLRTTFPGRAIEVYNLGISGTNSGYWLDRINTLLAMQPDLVIQYNAINDIAYSPYYEGYYRQHPVRGLLRKSFFFRLFPPDPQEFRAVHETVYANMQALQGELHKHGIAYLTATFATPDPESLPEDLRGFLNWNVAVHWGARARYLWYRDFHAMMGAYNAGLLEQMAARGIPVVRMHEQPYEGRDFIDVCHMTDAGIRKQAAAFHEAVSAILQQAAMPALQ